ncbi:hypothetical protein [Bradyrhizobium guangzhouense]|uniref:Uncharacterized protein n=1 Tax=Bradyrhizobium guangzhouense TaxID=1325095 RepID=A0AAE5WWN3_9BRAD|nr:hypothetical protein [Bradyrhizobium guangzhouense]QAU44479.1 hypothetical protein XH91_03320 [Bradyrhizobium guangzhouense]RXH06001.1 hypothetical protein EAS56_34880 [Bradyrhizobium guangzhouense]RXH12241.1 hypothetical protein EAS54_27340 [Bradyrhizobium guangzhouense]
MTAFCRAAPWLALALTLAAAPATAASSPPPGFVLTDDADLAFTSPDGATRLEQYVKDAGDFDVKWQVWARRGDRMTELKPEQGYGAGFRFTADSQWLVRMQKTGSGEQDLFLYHAENGSFVSATRTKSLSELAWAYFYGRPETKRFAKLDFHISANLLKGTEEAYRWLGVDWPNNRYLVISLAGQYDKHPKNTVMKGLGGWQCRYDLKTGTFDVPAMFAKENADALTWEVKRE